MVGAARVVGGVGNPTPGRSAPAALDIGPGGLHAHAETLRGLCASDHAGLSWHGDPPSAANIRVVRAVLRGGTGLLGRPGACLAGKSRAGLRPTRRDGQATLDGAPVVLWEMSAASFTDIKKYRAGTDVVVLQYMGRRARRHAAARLRARATGAPSSATTVPLHGDGTATPATEEACKLPWSRLPEPALDEALDRFFMVHHNPALPYHDLPQFKLILVSCELSPLQPAAVDTLSRQKRARGVSQWVRAACAPTLAAHVTAQSAQLLCIIEMLAPHLEESDGELEDLMSRAVVIMCIEPAATSALPVWVSWLGTASPRSVRASISATATLTAFEYFAVLADAAVRAMLLCTDKPDIDKDHKYAVDNSVDTEAVCIVHHQISARLAILIIEDLYGKA
ncbi:hypothetical protein HF086_015855 [Spodoptera exigua]|uniref:Uncharacterized protein n=1 Tax=Spodoptera exigua TaxID=7107 RepID=A0A922S9P4_SPOEX|nr:hypothetical protein HF086_015855 [Spodoptera exigua]